MAAVARTINVGGKWQDAPRKENRVRLRVVTDTVGATIPGHALTPGENIVEVYESEVPAIEAEVENDHAAVAMVQKRRDEVISKWQAEEERKSGTRPAAKDHPDVEWRWFAAAFKRWTGRSMKALKSVEVLDRDIPPPETADERSLRIQIEANAKATAAAVAAGVREALSSPAAKSK